MAYETRSERPPRRGRVDDSGGDTEGGKKLYYHLTLLAENDQGYRNLIQLASLAFMEGYYYKPRRGLGAARQVPRRVDRNHGLSGRPRAAVVAPGRREGGARQGRAFAGDLRQGQPVRRAARPRPAGPARHESEAHRDRPQDRCAADGNQRLALRASRRSRGARRAVVRADRGNPQRSQAVQVRGPRALPEDLCGDEVPVPRFSRGVRQHVVDRRAGRGQHRVRQSATARFPDRRRVRRRCHLPRPSDVGGCQATMGRRTVVLGRRAVGVRVAGHQEHGLRLVLPDRLGSHQTREGCRHQGRSRAGLRRRLRGRLLPAHHRSRPDQVRPAVRTLPQPQPHLDARHRHGLRLALPRRNDPLRGREVRPRSRGPDHHLRHHQGPQRGPRRGTRARLSVRSRRQDRQGDAAAGDGSRHAAEVLLRADAEVPRRLQGGQRTAGDVRCGSRREARRRRRQGSRGSEAQ